MRSLVLGGPRDIRYEDVPDPALPDGRAVIVRTTLCGICGSDLHPYHVGQDAIAPDNDGGAFCIGHEAVGEVVEVGREVRKFKAGDRVLLPGTIGCGGCPACDAKLPTLCRNGPPTVYGQGMPGIGGCQAEAVMVPNADAGNLEIIPPGVSDVTGLFLTDNLCTAWYAARRARTGPGDIVVVIGLGAVGLQAVISAFAQGAERVIALDLVSERRAEAAKLGAETTDETDVVAAVFAMTGGRGADVVIDANGGPVTTPLAVSLTAMGGRISIVGVSEAPTVAMPMPIILYKSLEIHSGICPIQRQIPKVLAAIEAGKVSQEALEALITHSLPLSRGAEAYELFDARRDGVKKVVLTPG